MALRINLYHEVLLARKKEQYDPLKLSMFGMIIVAVCLVGYYVVEIAKKSTAVSAASAAKAEYDQLLPQATAAKEREEKLTKEIGLADKLTQRIEGRFYWAPVLEHVASAVPRNVQILKLSGDVTGESPKRCQLTLDGTAAGTEPRRVAEELRLSLAERVGTNYQNVLAVFKTLEERVERVNLDGNQFPTVMFTISLSFEPQKSTKAEPAGTPVSRRIAQKD